MKQTDKNTRKKFSKMKIGGKTELNVIRANRRSIIDQLERWIF
jgi:hypothetical protein